MALDPCIMAKSNVAYNRVVMVMVMVMVVVIVVFVFVVVMCAMPDVRRCLAQHPALPCGPAGVVVRGRAPV